MIIPGDIQSAMQSVLAVFGSAWTYRTLTSAKDAEARAYSATTAMTAQKVSEQNGEVFDEKRGAFVRKITAQIKVTDAVSLTQGDQVIDAAGLYWHVDGSADAADIDGIKRYSISRDVPLKGSADRGGGV